VDDILEELGAAWSLSARSALPVLGATKATEEAPAASVLGALDCREIAVFEALGYDPQSTDALCSATGLPANQLVQSLLLLELDGLVSSAPGGFQKIA